MKTKQDIIKDILKRLTGDEINEIREELKEIKSFPGHMNHILTDRQRAVMTLDASEKFKEVFDILKLDYTTDANLLDTPMRISSMWVNELMVGRYEKEPRIEDFPADTSLQADLDGIEFETTGFEDIAPYGQVDGMDDASIIVSKRVDVQSLCSHHFMPFFNNDNNAYAIISYRPNIVNGKKRYLGISKLQRIVNHYARRPQLQENLTYQIFIHISKILKSKDLMIVMKNITHTCESLRGVQTICGKTSTLLFSGIFNDSKLRLESISLAD